MKAMKRIGNAAALISAAAFCAAFGSPSSTGSNPSDLNCSRISGSLILASEKLEPGEVSQYALKPGEYYYVWNKKTLKKRAGKEDDGFPGVYVRMKEVKEEKDPIPITTTRKAKFEIVKYGLERTVACCDYRFFPAPSPDELAAGQ